MNSRAPLIVAIVLLLLPLPYVGSYLALVHPFHRSVWTSRGGTLLMRFEHYRWGGSAAAVVFWPLEQIDRQFRPEVWTITILR